MYKNKEKYQEEKKKQYYIIDDFPIKEVVNFPNKILILLVNMKM